RILPADALQKLGGAAGALARHGDVVLAGMRPQERHEARRLLLTLLTTEETRERPTEQQLLAGAQGRGETEASALPAARAALKALVDGRLVVAGETYEIAHEALVRVWPRLRGWLDEAKVARAASARLS